MAVSNITAVFSCGLKEVWNLVTSLSDFSWRSDISRIEVTESGKAFTEYTKEGYATQFVITALEPVQRYEFDMENENIKGHWTGIFTSRNGKTEKKALEQRKQV